MTREYYDTYDKIYFTTTKIIGFINRNIYPVRRTELSYMLDHIQDEKLKVLDYGCGAGHIAAKIKQVCRTCDVHATDINFHAIDFARQKHEDIRFWKLGDELFAERDFDVIIISHVLEHIANRPAFLKPIVQMLKKNGLLIIAVPQERIRGDATLVQIVVNALRGNFKNPHLVKINYAHLEELYNQVQVEIKHSIYTNYLPPIRSKTRKWHVFSLVTVGEKVA